MPYGQYENTSFNGQTFTLGNVGLTGATGPDLVSSDPSKPVRVNGVVPSAGGGGGDVYTNQSNTFTQVNTFNANTVLSTMDTGVINTTGNITASGTIFCATLETTGNIKATGNVEAFGNVECENVDCAGLEATANVQCVDVDASGDITCVGVAASTVATTGDINIVGGNLVCDGDMTAETLVTQGNITATVGTSIIHGNTLMSDTNISCGAGGNFFVGSSQIASSNLFDVNNLLNTSATGQIKTGTLEATELRTTNGSVNFTAGTGANIQNDTGNNVLITSTTNATDSINWRLGTSGNDALKLRYDANGGGEGIPRYFLEMLDPSISPGPSYFKLSGNSGYDIDSLVALINSSSFTFNGATTTTFDAGNTTTFNNTVLLNGTTTVAAGTTDIGKSGLTYGVFGKLAALNDRTDASFNPTKVVPTLSSGLLNLAGWEPVNYKHKRSGTNGGTAIYFIQLEGIVVKTGGFSGNSDQIIFTLPVGFRPAERITFRAQGRTGNVAGRVDIANTGEVIFIDAASDAGISDISLSGLSFYSGI